MLSITEHSRATLVDLNLPVLHVLLTVAPLVAVLVVAMVVAMGLGRVAGSPPPTDRLVSLDGLRGYLALSVFVHHAMMWRDYVQRGLWGYDARSVPFYRHLGEDSVSLFFMMTGFLFAAKLARGRAHPIDWTRLYASRVLRIYPLYAVAFVVVLLLVAALTGFERHVPPTTLARGMLAWAHFGAPDLNGLESTWRLTSGVQWSLAYEWLFYSALPLAALLFGVVPPARWLVASALGVAVWAHWIGSVDVTKLGAFGGGLLASVVTRPAAVRAALGGPAAALGAIAAVVTAVTRFGHGYQWPVVALLAVAFTIVASGNSLFGVLRWPASRLLGEISYSIYLLHGLLLFGALRGVLGPAAAAALPTAAYWGVVAALTVVLVVVAFATFRLVERPGIGAMPHAQRWLTERRAGLAASRPLVGRVPAEGA